MTPQAEAQREASGQRLSHVFAPGLRFNTELQFLAEPPGGRRTWRKLPAPEVRAQDSGWMALLQACSLATGLQPWMDALTRGLGPDVWSGEGESVAQRIEVSGLCPIAQWWSGWDGATELVQEPVAAMACLQQSDGLSWALVTGVELPVDPEGGTALRFGRQATALLLLDPCRPAPWGVAYNARLLRQEGCWRGLDGEVGQAGLVGLITLRHRRAKPARS